MQRIAACLVLFFSLLCSTLLAAAPAGAAPSAASLPTVRSVCGLLLPPLLEAHPAPGVSKKTTPVVIVGGTLAPEILYLVLEERLRSEGYAVRFFPLPEGGTIDIRLSAATLACVVDEVRALTRSPKVHLIGHSQGSMVSRAYIKLQNAEDKVESLISLAGPNQGTQVPIGLFLQYPFPTLLGCYQGSPNSTNPNHPCNQMSEGSAFVQLVNDRPANDPIYYTNFITTDDAWIVPYTNGFMTADCDKTNALGEHLECNVHIQSYCPNLVLPIDHALLPLDQNVWNGIRTALLHRAVDLGCGLPPAAPSNLECESSEVRDPVSGLRPYAEATARVPAAKLAQGFVRVGGGCEVSRFGNGSVHATVMVKNAPDGADGWTCKGADPALIVNPTWARATVTYCRIEPKVVPSQRLECQTLSNTSALAFNPLVSVEITPAMVADGYQVVSGGCASSHSGSPSIHAENVVRSTRNATGLGWSCQAADPPNIAQLATVTATVLACRSKIDNGDRLAFTQVPALQCSTTRGQPVTALGPVATAAAANPAQRVVGGECELSWFLNGSLHAEFMTKHGPNGLAGWTCQGWDPPFLPNLATAQATVTACNVSLGVR